MTLMNSIVWQIGLAKSHQRLYKHAIFVGTVDRRASKRAFQFLCVLAGALSTHHACRAIVAVDLYTRNRFSESVGSRFGSPGQKALPHPFIQDLFLWHTRQEFVKTDLYPLSLISLRYAVCSTDYWPIIGRCVRACQRSNCAEERLHWLRWAKYRVRISFIK